MRNATYARLRDDANALDRASLYLAGAGCTGLMHDWLRAVAADRRA